MRKIRIVLSSFLLGLFLMPIFAQDSPLRIFPSGLQYGTLRVAPTFEASINNKEVRLAPGMPLYNASNMLIAPFSLGAETPLVGYTLDAQGFVKQAWILSDSEKKKAKEEIRKFQSLTERLGDFFR